MSLKAILLFSLCVLGFSSCKDNNEPDPAKPVINLTEIGRDNSKTVTAGNDLHLDASIVAEGLIRQIDIEIRQEDGDFKIEIAYTEGKYIGVINADFHEHIDIPADAPAGEYHLHFIVTDQLGQTKMESEELRVDNVN